MEYILESQLQRNVEKRIILPDDMNELFHICQLTLGTQKNKIKRKTENPTVLFLEQGLGEGSKLFDQKTCPRASCTCLLLTDNLTSVRRILSYEILIRMDSKLSVKKQNFYLQLGSHSFMDSSSRPVLVLPLVPRLHRWILLYLSKIVSPCPPLRGGCFAYHLEHSYVTSP